MADRRPSFSFRFWSSAAPPPRRTTEAQTTSKPPPTTPQPTTETKTAAQPTTTTTTTTSTSTTPPTAKESAIPISSPSTPTNPPKTETQTDDKGPVTAQPSRDQQMAGRQDNTTSPTTPPPTAETKTAGQSAATPTSTSTGPPPATTIKSRSPPINPPKTKTQMDDQQTNSTSAMPTDEPQTKSSSTVQSRSPPQPSSPSRMAPQARTTPSSPSRMDSQIPSTHPRTQQLRSPSRVASRSPKQTSSPSTKGTLPSKESQSSTKEISNPNGYPTIAPNEKGPKPTASQQEPPLKPRLEADVKSDSAANDFNVQTNRASTAPVEEPETPTPTQKLSSSTITAENKPRTELKPEETKVKEIVQVTDTEAIVQTKKEANDFPSPKSVSEAQNKEKAEIPSEQALHTKEIPPILVDNLKRSSGTASQTNKRTMIKNTPEKSALPKMEHVPLNRDIRSDISTFVNRVTNGDTKSAIYDRPLNVITLAGENRGASMLMGSNYSKREGSVHIHRGYKINLDEDAEVTTNGEGSSQAKKSEDAKGTEDQTKDACVNSNAQGINNSIVFKSSISEKDPGVHMVINHVPKELIESTYKSRTTQTRKAEFNTTPADKHTYDPKVRRRCLRGLFLEPSDSDPENSEKPRRHGCLVGCKEKSNENNIDVL